MKPFATLSEIRRRTAEAVIAQSGINNESLGRQLREMLGSQTIASGSLLQEPVVEGAHPFEPADIKMREVHPDIIHPAFVSLLDELDTTNEYRFPRTRKPFKHQLEAWTVLANTGIPQSVLVTSGTGSGKTECFLFPILSDLVRQSQGQVPPIEGVQAIMLYPLNALIESQRSRLSAWTKPLKGKIRYCLYNGDLPQDAYPESERRRSPEQQIDRHQLRESPAPLLVTNITMLEYMLARAQDQPIIEKSKGKLKWIVLDEAHSLVGAAAAEIALLLRRVLIAFNTDPQNVHFVATSATIGKGSDTHNQLKQFLAEVAGIPDAQVHVIEGDRRLPERPTHQADKNIDFSTCSPTDLYEKLGGQPDVWKFVTTLKERPQPISEFARLGQQYGLTAEEFMTAMAKAERIDKTNGDVERLAPMRIHSFERAIPGMWGCINPGCSKAPEGWPFGQLYGDRLEACLSCAAPVMEVVSCTECGEPMLEADEHMDSGRLRPSRRTQERDEFQFEADREFEGDDPDENSDGESALEAVENPAAKRTILFAATPSKSARELWMSSSEWKVQSEKSDASITFRFEEKHSDATECPCCSTRALRGIDNLLRPLRFGAPFMIGNAAPILLDGVDPKSPEEQPLPASGRGLISFTDSRQGTARMSAKIQAEAERNFVRSFIYHSVQDASHGQSEDPALTSLKGMLQSLEGLYATAPSSELRQLVETQKSEIERVSRGKLLGIKWADLVDRLAQRPEVEFWIKDVWEPRDPERFADPTKLSEFLLLREFSRRPRKANSVETLGLACLRFERLESCVALPEPFARRGRTIHEWREFLHAVVNHFIRANSAVNIHRDTMRWISNVMQPRSLLAPGSAGGEKKQIRWPSVPKNAASLSMPQSILLRALSLNLSDNEDRADLQECLDQAWRNLQPILGDNPEHRALDFKTAHVCPILDAYQCPVTRRLLDTSPFGLTPYARGDLQSDRFKTKPVSMPKHPSPVLGRLDPDVAKQEIRQWLESDVSIQNLKAIGAWSGISDRIAFFANYARSAEHSAQQENKLLRRYEADFKDGRINILNCSTTMEMGVDIGSVSTVMMTNVPPSIANYRQRVGRAGRRGQAFSLAFTFCRDRPLDREAFSDPLGYLNRNIAAPKVALNSRPIVQRHVNAYLLRRFIMESGGDGLKMTIGSLMGCPPKVGEARTEVTPIGALGNWLSQPSLESSAAPDLQRLVARSVLEGETRLIEACRDALTVIEEDFVNEWIGLQALARDEGVKEAGKNRMAVELKRLCGEFLLSALADRGFLPGHGFPTSVVTFIPHRPKKVDSDVGSNDGKRHTRLTGPQRSLDLAIRDYAPGSEVVLDGLVHRSAGVLLNWKRPATEEKVREVQSLKFHWTCSGCGASESARDMVGECHNCGNRVICNEYLRPSGFAVDYWKKPHADTDRISYVAPEDPAVTPGNDQWIGLPIPELGRYRGSREGTVYYSNRGPERNGYALCLHCGRAEPDYPNEEIDDTSSSRPSPLDGHWPLRSKLKENHFACEGLDSPWKIKRNLDLGHEITTDVFEIQPATPLTKAAGTALIIAMRGALARTLGVEADEMGYSTHRSIGELGGPCRSLLVFDRTSGGAGFAVSMGNNIADVLVQAAEILNCPNPGCTEACASCVLTSDAPFEEGALDRIAALEFVARHLTFNSALSDEDRISADATLSVSLIDELARELRNKTNPKLKVYLAESADMASISTWPAIQHLETWRYRGYEISVVAPAKLLQNLDSSGKLALNALGQRLARVNGDTSIECGEQPLCANGAMVFASIATDSDIQIWASKETSPHQLGPSWGLPIESPIVRGTVSKLADTRALKVSELLPLSTAKMRSISKELDRPMALFGSGMAEIIRTMMSDLGFKKEMEIDHISYSDPYMRSPLVARLLLDTTSSLFRRSTPGGKVYLTTRQPNPGSYPPSRLASDWNDGSSASASMVAYAALRQLNLDVKFGDCAHGRYMTIAFADGGSAKIVLDQGFGAWMPSTKDKWSNFDFGASPARQAEALAKVNPMLSKKGNWATYVVVTRE